MIADNAQQVFDTDALLRGWNARLLEGRDGRAVVSMPVSAAVVQGHGTCHGGALFALADATFGIACNAGGTQAVAQHCTITYLRPAKLGDVLTVEVERRSQTGRSGVYDGTLRNQDGAMIAEFRGISRNLVPRAG